jgi:hypothetical protein
MHELSHLANENARDPAYFTKAKLIVERALYKTRDKPVRTYLTIMQEISQVRYTPSYSVKRVGKQRLLDGLVPGFLKKKKTNIPIFDWDDTKYDPEFRSIVSEDLEYNADSFAIFAHILDESTYADIVNNFAPICVQVNNTRECI